ncbi:MAG: MFS transporter [Candidatus Latescibacterota bacterium]|nr:MFS transporter [Candidatus Latescibacterota bacterium]
MAVITNPFSAWNKNFSLLAVAVAGTGVFFGIQLTLFNNFIVERLNIQPHELGSVEALREVPGFLNAFFLALIIRFAPPKVAAISLVIMGLGIAMYAEVTSVFLLASFSLVWSLGFHCWLPLEQSMGLIYSPTADKGRWLGQLRSIGSLAWLVAIGTCMVLLEYLRYEGVFVLAGMCTAASGLALLFVDPTENPKGEKSMVFKRCYLLYYALNFLQGLRKQMFITFAIFALVKVHGMPVETTMVLVLINQTLITLTASWMGRLVDRHGERRMLSVSYIVLACVFMGYAFVDHRPSLYALYCLDNLIFFGGIALTTYAHKIAPPDELKPTLSMGVTMNHVAAVAAPLVGGYAWLVFGYEVIFISGSILALVSLVVTQWVDPAKQSLRVETVLANNR